MKIVFKEITYSNFRSVGNVPITVKLNAHKTTLVSGQNGSGKTTLLNALCFALFGRGYGAMSKSSLINSINLKQLLVTVSFDIGKKSYVVKRGMKPGIFEITENGKLVNQDPNVKDYQKVLEQQILKFNFRAFTQVVAVGGSEYIPFMKLSAKDRREFVEDLLDIRVFTAMNLLIKDQAKELKESLTRGDVMLKAKKEKIVLQNSFIDRLNKDRVDSVDVLISHVATVQEDIHRLTTQVEHAAALMAACEEKVNEHSALDDKITTLRLGYKALGVQLSDMNEKQKFYATLEHCPTCSQHVDDMHRAAICGQVEQDIAKASALVTGMVKEEEGWTTVLDSYDVHLKQFATLSAEIVELNKQIYANNAIIKNANAQIMALEADTSNVDDETEKMREQAKEYMSLVAQKKAQLETQQYQDFVQRILADSGIKAKIIKQYIPTINKLVNKYLAAFDIFLAMHLDENFNETFKSRHRDNFTYDSFSDGQKRRIDIALLLAWMSVAKAKNAIHVNIAFFDEIDATLDKEGSDLLHSALHACPADNIFIVSHKADLLADKTDYQINFVIKNNFTQIS